MKQNNRQYGSAHVVIIVTLTVIITGLLGFVFWQNFLVEKPNNVPAANNTAPTTTTDNTVNTPPSSDASKGYLVIKEWGVRFKLPDSAKIQWEKNEFGYFITTEDWQDICGNGQARPSGFGFVLTRSREKNKAEASPPTALNNEEKIGDYYYYMQGPQSICKEDSGKAEQTQYDILEALLKTIEKVE